MGVCFQQGYPLFFVLSFSAYIYFRYLQAKISKKFKHLYFYVTKINIIRNEKNTSLFSFFSDSLYTKLIELSRKSNLVVDYIGWVEVAEEEGEGRGIMSPVLLLVYHTNISSRTQDLKTISL